MLLIYFITSVWVVKGEEKGWRWGVWEDSPLDFLLQKDSV